MDNNKPKVDITRICAIKMAHNYNVLLVQVFIIWLSNTLKSVILTTHRRL